jgi:hypothetical protein
LRPPIDPHSLERVKASLDHKIEHFRHSDLTLAVNALGLLELEILREIVEAWERGRSLESLNRELARIHAALPADGRPKFVSAILGYIGSHFVRGRKRNDRTILAWLGTLTGRSGREIAQAYRGRRDVSEYDIDAARKAVARFLKKADEKR